MPEPIGINDMHVHQSGDLPRDGTLSRANAADNPDHGDASGGGDLRSAFIHDDAHFAQSN